MPVSMNRSREIQMPENTMHMNFPFLIQTIVNFCKRSGTIIYGWGLSGLLKMKMEAVTAY